MSRDVHGDRPVEARDLDYAVDRLADNLCRRDRERVRIATILLSSENLYATGATEDIKADNVADARRSIRNALAVADLLLEEAES